MLYTFYSPPSSQILDLKHSPQSCPIKPKKSWLSGPKHSPGKVCIKQSIMKGVSGEDVNDGDWSELTPDISIKI